MTKGVVENRFVSRLENSGSGSGLLSVVVADALPADDELLAEALSVYAQRVRACGGALTLTDFRSAVPWLHEAPASLAVAVDEVVAAARQRGRPLAEIAHELAAEHPAVMAAIREAVLVRSTLERTLGTLGDGGGTEARSLPCEIGDVQPDGRRRYELRAVLGRGSQGVVYAAVDRLFSESLAPSMVAVKIVSAAASPASAAREAALTRRVNHPGVVRVLDRGDAGGGESFAVLELVDGLALDRWAAEHRDSLTLRERVRLVAEIAEAVAAAHQLGVLHRDLKPGNVLVDREGRPRVTDFGIACVAGVPLDGQGGYSPRGSLAFMSPEQFHGDVEQDTPAADVYGLGGILFWLVCNAYPNGDDVSAAIAHLSARGGPDTRRLRGLPPTVRRILTRALAPRAADRYGSASALAADLCAWLDHRPIEWMRPGAARRVQLAVRRSPKSSAAVGALLLVLIGGAWLFAARLADSRAETREAQDAVERAELQRQLQAQAERIERSATRTRAVREVLERWTSTISRIEELDEPAFLMSLALFQNSAEPDDRLLALFKTGAADVAVRGLADADTAPGGRVVPLMWRIVAGHTLVDDGRYTEGRRVLLEARQMIVDWTGDDEPVVRAIDARLKKIEGLADNPTRVPEKGSSDGGTTAAP